jgi:hypothetical protein
MTLALHRDAILTTNLPEHSLCAGDIGTVVDRHAAPGYDDAYSVEFFDLTGRTVAVVVVPESSLRAPTPADRPSAGVAACA